MPTEPTQMITGDVMDLHHLIYAERLAHAAEVAELHRRLEAAKSEGAAEYLERLAGKFGQQYVGTRRYTTPELLEHAAALRKQVQK